MNKSTVTDVGLLAAVATGDVVGLAAVVIIESVEKQQTCKASSGAQLEGTVLISLLLSVLMLNRSNGRIDGFESDGPSIITVDEIGDPSPINAK